MNWFRKFVLCQAHVIELITWITQGYRVIPKVQLNKFLYNNTIVQSRYCCTRNFTLLEIQSKYSYFDDDIQALSLISRVMLLLPLTSVIELILVINDKGFWFTEWEHSLTIWQSEVAIVLHAKLTKESSSRLYASCVYPHRYNKITSATAHALFLFRMTQVIHIHIM